MKRSLTVPCIAVGVSFLAGIVIAQTWFYPQQVQPKFVSQSKPKPGPAAPAQPREYTADFAEASLLIALQTGKRYLDADLGEWVECLAEKDWPRALRLLLAQPQSTQIESAAAGLGWSLERWSKNHPEILKKVATDKTLPPTMNSVRLQALRVMIRTGDARSAWSIFQQDREGFGIFALQYVAQEWARTDGKGAASFGLSLAQSEDQKRFMGFALNTWLEDNPRAGHAWIIAQSDIQALREHVDMRNWHQVMMSPRDEPPFEKLEAYATLIPELETNHLRGESLFRFIWHWPVARKHAAEWISRITDDQMRDSAWMALIEETAKTDTTAAARLSDNITDPERLGKLTSTFAATTARVNFDQAWSYAQSLPDDTARVAARLSALTTWREEQPDRAHEFALSHASEMTAFELAAFGKELAHVHQPESGVSIAALARDDIERAAAVATVMEVWADHAPRSEILTWIKGQSHPTQRDAAIAGAATVFELGSRELLDLAMSIRQPTLRIHAIEDAARNWLYHDLPAGRAWIMSPASRMLPADAQARLREHALNPLYAGHPDESGHFIERVGDRDMDVHF